MELQHTFRVPAPIEQAWTALLDVDQVTGCLPGAKLTSYDGETFAAAVKVKIGAIQLAYAGQGRFVERDPDARRVVIEAAGKERRGGGTVAATVTCALEADGGATVATVRTDLTITGKPAQFGRGAIEDLSARSSTSSRGTSPPGWPPRSRLRSHSRNRGRRRTTRSIFSPSPARLSSETRPPWASS
ncbi:SRPBCC family protein [Amycolatopsis sp. 3B14]|uniref:SRPBCC family protein n=1 Tax=Amycolatopsis sp. 3B14 TaxID=3243600 RepID=UPI003D969949